MIEVAYPVDMLPCRCGRTGKHDPGDVTFSGGADSLEWPVPALRIAVHRPHTTRNNNPLSLFPFSLVKISNQKQYMSSPLPIPTMSTETRNWIALKGIALAATFSVATTQSTASLLVLPSLLRPLNNTTSTASSSRSPSRPSSSLRIPTVGSEESGRLTPQPQENKVFNFSLGTSGTYKAVAQQFAQLDALNFRVCVPIEIFAIGVFSVAAWRARSVNNGAWVHWAATAGAIASIFPYTGALMAPLVHKVKRLGGDEEKIEPYEDAPIDREAEKSNTVEFLGQWGLLNAARAAMMYAATGVGLYAFAME